MAITWQGFSSFVSMQLNAVQAAAQSAIDTSKGSVTLAYAQATAGVALWLQAAVAAVLRQSRASTSVGPDLDSWMGDWYFTRPGGAPSSGYPLFSRGPPTLPATIS